MYQVVISSPTSLQYAGACYGIVPLLLLFPNAKTKWRKCIHGISCRQKHNPNIAILAQEISCETACLSCGNSWTRKLPFVDKTDRQVVIGNGKPFQRKGKPNMTIAHGTSKTQQVFYFFKGCFRGMLRHLFHAFFNQRVSLQNEYSISSESLSGFNQKNTLGWPPIMIPKTTTITLKLGYQFARI